MKKVILTIIIIILLSSKMQSNLFIPWKTSKLIIPEHFPKLKDIEIWMKQISLENSDFVKLVPYGKSYNNLLKDYNLFALEIAHKDYNQKKYALLNGGIHPRELMSIYSIILWVNNLIFKIKKKDEFWYEYIKYVKLIVIPLINPDGYEMVIKGWNWRKNTHIYRYISPHYAPNSYGVDLNRNFPKFFIPVKFSFHYTWGGPEPLSEPETKYLVKYLENKKIEVSLSLHSYGRFVSFPWWGSDKKIPCYLIHKKVIFKLKKIMKTYSFRQGTGYRINGNFGDWIYEKNKCLTFSIEIGDNFNPDKKTSILWYKQIEEGIYFILAQAFKNKKYNYGVE